MEGGDHSVFANIGSLKVLKNIKEPIEGRYIYQKVVEKMVYNAEQQPQYNLYFRLRK